MKYLEKTIEYGLYLLVFLLPIQTRWIIKAGELEYTTYSLYGTDILLILLLLTFVIYKFSIFNFQFSNNFQFNNFQTSSKFWWFIGGLLLTSAVSVFFAIDKALALYKFGWLALGVGLFLAVVKANYSRWKLAWSLLIGLGLQAGLAIWQFLTQSSFANKWLGLALHNGADLGASVIEAVGANGLGERWLRAYGGLDHPNILGGVLAVGIILLAGESVRRKKVDNFQFSIFNFQTIFNAQIFKIVTWIFLVLFSAALFFSFSRSAWLGLAIGLGIMMVLAAASKNLKLQKGLAEIILIMGILLFILFNQYQNLITSRLAGQGRLEEKSTSERLASYQESWQLIKNNWASGVGLGNYTLALNRQRPGQESFYYQPTHSIWLLVWAETGILGLLFFMGLIVYLIIFNFQCSIFKQFSIIKFSNHSLKIENCKLKIGENNYANNSSFNISVLASLAVLLAIDHWLWSLHFGVLFFWLVLGVIASSKRQKKLISI